MKLRILTWVTIIVGEPVNLFHTYICIFFFISFLIEFPLPNSCTNSASGRVSWQSSTSARSVCSIGRLRCLVRRDSEAVSFENAPFFRPYIRFSESIVDRYRGKNVCREKDTSSIVKRSLAGNLKSFSRFYPGFISINVRIMHILTDHW